MRGQEVGDPLGEERALELMAKLRAAQGKMDGALEARTEPENTLSPAVFMLVSFIFHAIFI